MRIGLISDTHMPERCFELPAALPQVFKDVDIILHAGDVGELWVLDELSRIAPVFAVHGNDDSPDAQRELPLQQLISVGGRRILLWHSHYPDRIDEMISRTDDLRPKLRRVSQRSRRGGASIAVFGHWHLPLVLQEGNVLLINPGTIELGNAVARQLFQTVALLELGGDGATTVAHVDLNCPTKPFQSDIDFDAGFRAALARFTRDLRSPGLAADGLRIRTEFERIVPENVRGAVYQALNQAAHMAWRDEKAVVTRADWIDALREAQAIPQNIRDKLVEVLERGE